MNSLNRMNKLFLILVNILVFSQIILAQTSLDEAEDFMVKDVGGNMHDLFSYLEEGKIVVLPFFTTTCGSCNIYTPDIVESFYDFGCNQGDVFYLGINWGANNIGVIDFMAAHAVEFPCASGLEGLGNNVNEQYEIASHITALVVLPDGTIAGNFFGPNAYPTRDSLNNLLLSLGAEMQNCTLGFEEKEKIESLSYPNPAINKINISFDLPISGKFELNIINMQGQLVQRKDLCLNQNKDYKINVSQLSKGVYLVQLKQKHEIILNQQIIKQ